MRGGEEQKKRKEEEGGENREWEKKRWRRERKMMKREKMEGRLENGQNQPSGGDGRRGRCGKRRKGGNPKNPWRETQRWITENGKTELRYYFL